MNQTSRAICNGLLIDWHNYCGFVAFSFKVTFPHSVCSWLCKVIVIFIKTIEHDRERTQPSYANSGTHMKTWHERPNISKYIQIIPNVCDLCWCCCCCCCCCFTLHHNPPRKMATSLALWGGPKKRLSRSSWNILACSDLFWSLFFPGSKRSEVMI